VRSCGLLVPVERIATPVAFVTSLAIALDDRNIICFDGRNPTTAACMCFESSSDPCARWTHVSSNTRRTSPALVNSQPKVLVQYLTLNIYPPSFTFTPHPLGFRCPSDSLSLLHTDWCFC